MHPNVAELPPPPSFSGENKRGSIHTVPEARTAARICGGHAEGEEVTAGRRGRRAAEDADVRCGGEERLDGRKYNKLLFGEKGQEWSHGIGS